MKEVEVAIKNRDYARLLQLFTANPTEYFKYLDMSILLCMHCPARVEMEFADADERLLALWHQAKGKLKPSPLGALLEGGDAKEFICAMLRLPKTRRFLALLVEDHQLHEDPDIEALLRLPFDSLAGVPLTEAEAEAAQGKQLHRLQLILFEMNLLPELALTNWRRAGEADFLRQQLSTLSADQLKQICEKLAERFRPSHVIDDLVRRCARPSLVWKPRHQGPWLCLEHFKLEVGAYLQQQHEQSIEAILERALLAHPAKQDNNGTYYLKGRGSQHYLLITAVTGCTMTADWHDLSDSLRHSWQPQMILAMQVTPSGITEWSVHRVKGLNPTLTALHVTVSELAHPVNLIANLNATNVLHLEQLKANLQISEEVLPFLLQNEALPAIKDVNSNERLLLVSSRVPEGVERIMVRPMAEEGIGSLRCHESIRLSLISSMLQICQQSGIPEEEFGWSCEAVESLYRRHLLPRWTLYQEIPEDQRELKPFGEADPRETWTAISRLYAELMLYRPLDYLPSEEAKLDYFAGHFAGILMLSAEHLRESRYRSSNFTSIVIDDQLSPTQMYLACSLAPNATSICKLERKQLTEHKIVEVQGKAQEPLEGVYQNVAQAEAALSLYDPNCIYVTEHPAQALLLEEMAQRQQIPIQVITEPERANCHDKVILVATKGKPDVKLLETCNYLALQSLVIIQEN